MKKYKIENIEVPAILESDILETIQQSRIILQQREEKKQITDSWKVKYEMLFRFGKYSFLTQIFLCFVLLLSSWILVGINNRNITIAFYLTGTILLSISMTIEQLRSRILMMSELEKTCPYSLEKLYGLKVTISSFIVFMGIVLSSFILSSDARYDFLLLVKGGCIPFSS